MSSQISIADEIYSARKRFDDGPLSARTLRAVEAMRSSSTQERVVDSAANYIANLVVTGEPVRFCEVSTDEDWRGVCELRQRCYPVALPYLVDVLDAHGRDHRDRHSFVYGAFIGDQAVATIRATVYPYETLDHLDEAVLASYLGADWKTGYVEWGRLLVDRGRSRMRLMPALITYAGLRLLLLTRYRHYFGYTKPSVRMTVSRFAIDRDTLRFQIPSRGSHDYLLTRGSFGTAALRELPKWLRRAGGSLGNVTSLIQQAAT